MKPHHTKLSFMPTNMIPLFQLSAKNTRHPSGLFLRLLLFLLLITERLRLKREEKKNISYI